jgi:transcription elongation factor GreA
MVEETTFVTAEGYEKLQAELEHLKTVRRREVAEQIRRAKEDGDISENAGYDSAKEEQAFVEGPWKGSCGQPRSSKTMARLIGSGWAAV